jgi:3-(3-hydroxy-phenyl)propionate hydroxylase
VPEGIRVVNLQDASEYAKTRYGAGWSYLIRPDQHVAAAWQNPSIDEITKAYQRARGAHNG